MQTHCPAAHYTSATRTAAAPSLRSPCRARRLELHEGRAEGELNLRRVPCRRRRERSTRVGHRAGTRRVSLIAQEAATAHERPDTRSSAAFRARPAPAGNRLLAHSVDARDVEKVAAIEVLLATPCRHDDALARNRAVRAVRGAPADQRAVASLTSRAITVAPTSSSCGAKTARVHAVNGGVASAVTVRGAARGKTPSARRAARTGAAPDPCGARSAGPTSATESRRAARSRATFSCGDDRLLTWTA